MSTRVEVRTALAEGERIAVVELLDTAAAADDTNPLSEQTMLHVRHGAPTPEEHVLLWHGETLAGYAHVDRTALRAAVAELVVHPELRRRGLAAQLVTELLELTDGRLSIWAHGSHPAATRLAARFGFVGARVLLQMRRSLQEPLPEPDLPDGVTVRTFAVGSDEEDWVRVNNRAFAEHPEQGGWSVTDIRHRESEPWFDANGFFLAYDGADLAGFHWTKVHGGAAGAPEPLGEVYVVGIDPAYQGNGLGRAITLVGLHHLRRTGLGQAMLYVEASNATAVRLYERLGFTRWKTDVSFHRG